MSFEAHPLSLYYKSCKSYHKAHDLLFKEDTVLTGGDTKVPENEVESVKRKLKLDDQDRYAAFEMYARRRDACLLDLDQLPSIGPPVYTEKRVYAIENGKRVRRSLRIAARQKD